MWIRSQDKTKLINAKEISCDFLYEGIVADKSLVAEYSTKEKALKVLDMIQEHICKLDYYDIVTEKEIENIVFQMPQDNEVE